MNPTCCARNVSMLLLALLLPCAAPSYAERTPEGTFKVENSELGFKFFCPRTLKEIPTEPGDPVVVGQYVERPRVSTSKRSRSASSSEMWIFSIPKPDPADPVASHDEKGEADDKATEKETSEKSEKEEATSHKEEREKRLAASSFEELLKKRAPKWRVVSLEEKEDRERSWKEYRLAYVAKLPKGATLSQRDYEKRATSKGAAWAYDLGDRVLGIVGFAPKADFSRRYKDFYRSARTLAPIEIDSQATEELAEYYRRNPQFKQPEFRIDRRKNLPRGWRSSDTDNYLILYHTRDSKLISRIEHDIEAMRLLYEEIFPPVKPINAVSVVRVCRNRKEYLDYGGRPTSAGYWNFVEEELVLFDNVAGKEGSKRGNQDSYIVLYHEAFHQYIHYSTGELHPHTWYNEGFGDYFSGAKIYSNSDTVKEVGSNPWRKDIIRKAVREKKHVPLSRLIVAPKAEYYFRSSLYYSEGWALIYFLNKSPVVRRRPEWNKILPVYFDTLKETYQQKLLQLSKEPTIKEKEVAAEEARKAALDAAFEDVDIDELEEEWIKFVKKIR